MRIGFDSALLRLAAGLLVVLLAAALLAARLDLPKALGLLDDIEVGWGLAGAAAFGVSKLIHGARWKVLMSPFASPSLAETNNLFLVGNLVNGLLPLRAGDIVRVQIAARRLGVPRAQMTSSVFVVETLFDGLAFAGMLFLALAFSDVPGLTRGVFFLFASASLLATVAAALLARRAAGVGHRIASLSFPGASRFGNGVEGILDGLRPFARLETFSAAVALSYGGWIVEALAYGLVGEAFNLGLDPADYLGVVVAANLLTALPLTPLGFGVYELGLQEIVGAFGPSAELAFAYVLGCHLLFTSWIVVAGILAAWTLPLRTSEFLYLRSHGGS